LREQLTVGSLFAGIGGFDLGLERAGMRVIWQSEIDPYACAVLRKHWPDVPNYGDIRGITAATVERPDVLCGGFPCQDISNAGDRVGIDGERSGLWSEFARVIGELRPRYVIVENTASLNFRGLLRCLGDFAALGYNAEWHCIPASAVGAPHERDRTWIVAYPERLGRQERCLQTVEPCETWRETPMGKRVGMVRSEMGREAITDLIRVDDGIPNRSHRMRVLGNAIVPQIAEVIGRAILEAECRSALCRDIMRKSSGGQS
jgi:DNA (cytosine-5)-methyltransferase 1